MLKYVEEKSQAVTNCGFNSVVPKKHGANGEFSFAC